jgi:predicted DNA-binding transcriptional regulator AlpA
MDYSTASQAGKACYSVDEFCSAHAISRAMFYKLRADGRAPRTMSVGSRTLISYEAAADWRRSCENAEVA